MLERKHSASEEKRLLSGYSIHSKSSDLNACLAGICLAQKTENWSKYKADGLKQETPLCASSNELHRRLSFKRLGCMWVVFKPPLHCACSMGCTYVFVCVCNAVCICVCVCKLASMHHASMHVQ